MRRSLDVGLALVCVATTFISLYGVRPSTVAAADPFAQEAAEKPLFPTLPNDVIEGCAVQLDRSASPEELVDLLGNESYLIREAAAEKLRALGRESVSALKGAALNQDLEIQLAAKRLLHAIAADIYDGAVKEFLAGSNEVEIKLPAWSHFREAVGSDRSARVFYVRLLEKEPEFLFDYEKNRAKWATELVGMLPQVATPSKMQELQPIDRILALGMLLFLAGDPDHDTDEASMMLQGHYLMRSPLAKEAVEKLDDLRPAFLKLLVRWMNHPKTPRGGPAANCKLWVGTMYGLKAEARALAIQGIEAKGAVPKYRSYAIVSLATIGSREDLPLLAEVMKDARATGLATTQYRDIALFAAIILSGKEPKEFGFTSVQSYSAEWPYLPESLVFASDETRDEAFEKWRKSWMGGD